MSDTVSPEDAFFNNLRRARMERREDLQGITEDHIGRTATTIALHNSARMMGLLFGMDPNQPLVIPSSETVSNQSPVSAPPVGDVSDTGKPLGE